MRFREAADAARPPFPRYCGLVSKKTARKTRSTGKPAPPPVGARRPLPRTWLYLGFGGVAVVAVVVLILASQLGGSDGGEKPSGSIAGAEAVVSLLGGIPQQGTVLGSPDAPVTLVEYADVQCPFCGEFARGGLPALLDEYVRPGKVKLEFRGLRFLGPDSEKALRVVLSAARQDKAWTVLELLFANQGEENKGWVTDALVRQIGEAVVGLDVEQMLAETDAPEVDALMEKAETQGQTDGVRGTPTFFVVREGVPPHQLELGSLEPGAFRPALDAALTP